MSHYAPHEKRTLFIYLFIFLLMAAGLSVGGFQSYRNFERQFLIQEQNQLLAVTELKEKGLVNWRIERLADAEALHQNPSFATHIKDYFEDPNNTLARVHIEDWLKSFKIYNEYEDVRLLDAEGQTRVSEPVGLPPISSVPAKRIPDVLQSKQVTLVDFYQREGDGLIRLCLLIPILDTEADNRVIGLVAISINPEIYLYPYISAWPSDSATAETLIVCRDGMDALFLNELRFQTDTALHLRISLEQTEILAVKAILGQTGVLEGVDYRGEAVIGALRAIPDSPWFLIARMDIAEVYAPLRARSWQTLFVVGMAIFVAGAGLTTVWRQQRIQFYRAQAESANAIRESERQLRESQAVAGLGTYVLDFSHGMWTSSAVLDSIFGIDEKFERTIEGWTALIHPSDRQHMADYFANEVIVRHVRFDREYRIVRNNDQAERWVHGLGELNFDSQGQLAFMLGTIQDITERKQTEEALLTSEARYRYTLDDMLEGCQIIGSDWRYLYLNDVADKHNRRPKEELLGKVYMEMWPGIESTEVFAVIRRCMEDRVPQSMENEFTFPEGGKGWFELRIYPVPEGSVILSIDITERKQSEQMIEARLRLIEFSNKHSLDELLTKTLDEVCVMLDSPIGFYHFVEPDQKTLSLQAWSTRTMQEYCKVEGKGTHYPVEQAGVWADSLRQRRPIMHNDYASLPASYKKGLPQGHAVLTRELVVPIMREDWVVAILGVGNKAHEYNEKDVDVAAYFADVAWEIVERKRAEKQLAEYTEKLEEMVDERTRELRDTQEKLVRQERLALLGQVAGSMGHELRNPLGVISNALYYLKLLQPNADDKVKEYLDMIEKEARTSDKIITDLLDFTRIKATDRKPVSVSELIHQTMNRFPAPPSVDVTLNIPTDLPSLFVDVQQLSQVLGNLTVNACQSMPNGGKLVIRAELSNVNDQPSISIAVED